MASSKYITKEAYGYGYSSVADGSGKIPFAVVEAYKSIRTNIKFLLTGEKGNVVTVSGSEMSEGKSTTALNLAVAFSQLGERVLLIDGDMRRSSVHKKLSVDNDKGLSNVLAGFCDFSSAAKHLSDNFDVLTAGQTPPNPSELLGSAKFDELIADLRNEYSIVIIDTPPITLVTDALIIAPKTDGVILVVREKFTTTDDVKKSIEAMKFANTKILGAIMNGVSPKKKKYYRYKYSKYSSYSR